MKPQTPFKKLNYIVPFLSMGSMKAKPINDPHLPLLVLNIDFEYGMLNLEGDWQYLMLSNNDDEPYMSYSSRNRVEIEALIYDAQPIDPEDHTSEGMVIPLEGIIKDCTSAGPCSGILVIDHVKKSNGLISSEWEINLYIYDTQQNNVEIKYNLPLLRNVATEYQYAN
jgi:hypothetical protein